MMRIYSMLKCVKIYNFSSFFISDSLFVSLMEFVINLAAGGSILWLLTSESSLDNTLELLPQPPYQSLGDKDLANNNIFDTSPTYYCPHWPSVYFVN